MQTREMWKNSKWKMVAGAATLSALGISGLALADPSSPGVPESIELSDQVQVSDARNGPTTLPDFVRGVSGGPFDDLDSPFDDTGTGDTASVTGDTPDDMDTLSGDTVGAAGIDSDSPEVVPSPTVPAPTLDDSASVSVDSADASSAS
ncbi:MAG TPA: hypothetical protein VM848_13895 [Acidimicrobiia bacterium]|nr:hypothetical protein [Acidimicrobiia bacterium]